MSNIDWHERAACNGAAPERFTPTLSNNGKLPDDVFLTAHLFCKPCPVRALCDAQRVAEGQGAVGLIWAGRLVTQGSENRWQLRVQNLLGGAA